MVLCTKWLILSIDLRLMVSENVKNIRHRIQSICERVKRNVDDIKIVAVTKTFSSQLASDAVRASILDLGENYVQELLKKKEEIHDDKVRWHFIGHLQTNKVKLIAGRIDLIHSVDSLRLAVEISNFCSKIGKTQNILIELNTSGETSKFGTDPDKALNLAKEIIMVPNISLTGLMTIGKFSDNPEESRKDFTMLREVKELIEKDGIALKHLSMGMSNDFEVAIEEGATIIRLGTAIFGARQYNN